MSRSYDIDSEGQDAKAALRAIKARINGDFDDPFLLAFGPLTPDRHADVETIVARFTGINWPDPDDVDALLSKGFNIGIRDPRLNTIYPGAYMVTEASQEELNRGDYELPTRDGANGPWCVVGDDLAELVELAAKAWLD